MSAPAPTKISPFRPPYRPAERPTFESGKPKCASGATPTQPSTRVQQPDGTWTSVATGAWTCGSGVSLFHPRYEINAGATAVCVSTIWCFVNVAINFFISQWAGRLSSSGLCQECTKHCYKNCTVCSGRVTTLINHFSKFILWYIRRRLQDGQWRRGATTEKMRLHTAQGL